LNLLRSAGELADYVDTGFWSTRASDEAKLFCKVNCPASSLLLLDPSSGKQTLTIPDPHSWKISPQAEYVHITGNETIQGLEFLEEPDISNGTHSTIPLVADMTSTLLSRPIDIKKYGLIYASSGKNLGPAGYTIVIIRKDLLEKGARDDTPSILNYKKMASSTPISSLYNTPPTFLIYMGSLILEEYLEWGGMPFIALRAKRRAEEVYQLIDESDGFYVNRVSKKYRSRQNVPFRLENPDLEKMFLKGAEQRNLFQLVGHPLFGGLRITLYNGVPDKAVSELKDFMKDFMTQQRL